MCENLCLCSKLHKFSLIWFFATCCCDKILLQRQICTKILWYTWSDLSLQHVALTFCCKQSRHLCTRGDLLPQCFAVTCHLVCTNLLQEVKSNGNSKTVTPNSSRGRQQEMVIYKSSQKHFGILAFWIGDCLWGIVTHGGLTFSCLKTFKFRLLCCPPFCNILSLFS